MLASQKALLDQAITRVETFRTQAVAAGIEVTQVSLIFPNGQPVVFEWAVEAEPPEFKIRTG